MFNFLIIFSYSVDFLLKEDDEGRIQGLSALQDAFMKEKDMQTAFRMALTIANFVYENDEAFSMLSTLDFKRPNIEQLVPAQGEQDVEKSRASIKAICDWLSI